MSSTNHTELIRRQYATDENLRIRQDTHDQYTVPDRSFADWVLDRVEWQGNEVVLDVGSGNGLYYDKLINRFPDITYYGLDLLPNMLISHNAVDEGVLAEGDVQHLPFPDNQFDVVMANHMLHHVIDLHEAVQELHRVLKPGGCLMVATNSLNNMPELQVLMRRAIVLLTRGGAAQVRAPEVPGDHFALENGTRVLSQHFYAVMRHDLPSALVFPEVEPAMIYLESTRDLREAYLPEDVIWDDMMMIMRQQINQLVKHLGELVINKQSGVLIASDAGGFVEEFVAQQAALSNK